MTHDTAMTDDSRRRIIVGMAMLMTVASASARKMPGATASSTSQGLMAGPDEGCGAAAPPGGCRGTVCVMGRVYPVR